VGVLDLHVVSRLTTAYSAILIFTNVFVFEFGFHGFGCKKELPIIIIIIIVIIIVSCLRLCILCRSRTDLF